MTAIPGLVFSGGLDGRLRAYYAENGKIAWDMDTKGDYQAVNGVAAKGGSIDGGGAVVVDGMVYVGSGSGFVGTAPGNVLLAILDRRVMTVWRGAYTYPRPGVDDCARERAAVCARASG